MPKKPSPPAPPKVAPPATLIRDRIKEFRRIPSTELIDNEKNWRVHPYAQRQAVAELLEKVGISGVLTVYHSPRNGGKLTLIDGHERKNEHALEWPCIVLDVSDEEADLLLLALDPLRSMAEADTSRLETLLAQARMETPAIEDMLRGLKNDLRDRLKEIDGEAQIVKEDDGTGPPEMELQPFESYDYCVVVCRTSLDWHVLADKLQLKRVGFTLKDGKTRKIGMGRVVDARRVLELLK